MMPYLWLRRGAVKRVAGTLRSLGGRTDPKRADEAACQRKQGAQAQADARRDTGRRQGEEQGHDDGAGGLAGKPRRALHAPGSTAALARGGEQHVTVVGRLEEAEAEAAEHHEGHQRQEAAVEGPEGGEREAAGEASATEGAKPGCRHAVGEAAGERRRERDREGPRDHVESGHERVLAEPVLEIERQS